MSNSTADVLTPIQRRKEIAAILGRGLLRFRDACVSGTAACDSAPESPDQKALDVSAPGDPHVSWLTQPRS
jgi:hypothetical protein